MSAKKLSMKMNEAFNTTINFVEQLKKLKLISHIYQIVLFGSVATGENTTASDIDIAIIHNLPDKFKLMDAINKFVHEKIQVTYINLKDLPAEHELISSLTGDGVLLYGQPLNIKINTKTLKPKILLCYDLSHLSKSDKMKLNRALHGSISRNKYKGKLYETKVQGITKEPGVDKFSRSVLILDRKKYAKITSLLKRFKAAWKERDILLY